MEQLPLRPDEGVLGTFDSVFFSKLLDSHVYNGTIVLTNLNLFFVKRGMWGSVKDIQTYPLRDIVIYDGAPQVCLTEGFLEGGTVKIGLRGGQCVVRSSSRKDMKEFANQLNRALSGKSLPKDRHAYEGQFSQAAAMENVTQGVMSMFAGDGGRDAPVPKLIRQPAQKAKVSGRCAACGAPLSGYQNETVCCSYCATECVLK